MSNILIDVFAVALLGFFVGLLVVLILIVTAQRKP